MHRHRSIIIALALTLACFAALSAIGVEPWIAGPASALQILFVSGSLAVAWMLAAWGLGTALLPRFMEVTTDRRAMRHASSPAPRGGGGRVFEAGAASNAPLALCLGAALMLFISHAMGLLGLLRPGSLGAAIACTPVALGLALFARSIATRRVAHAPAQPPSWLLLAAAPAVAVMLLAACCPPGTLWASEARGFDVLSYHLQLPREWLAAAQLRPLEHNAYSWLPSYMEAAYLHLGAMASFATPDPFTTGDAIATPAASLLHAIFALAAAWAVAALASAHLRRVDAEAAPSIAALAAVLFLTIPWVVVTGSLAYNEMPVCLMLAGSLLALESPTTSPPRRAALIGLLTAAACAAKPTSLFMVAAPVGLLLLSRTPRKQWGSIILAASLAGLAMLAPYLLRNYLAGGNPVFPFLTSLLGDAHWTALEADRWRIAHHESISWFDRLAHLLTGRGFRHRQWTPFPLAAAAALAWSLATGFLRRFAAILGTLMLLQILLWLTIGHQQSRFLLPVAVPIATIIALIGGPWSQRWARTTSIGWALMALVVTAFAVIRLYRSTPVSPGILAVGGVDFMTGEAVRTGFERDLADNAPTTESLFPHQFINLGGEPSIRRLYLFGDSTPFYYHVPVLYHTTWDPSPLGSLLRESAGDLATATRRLAAPSPQGPGVSHVLINFSELVRLHDDQWYDPDATLDIAERLIRDHGRVIREWPLTAHHRIVLIELVPR